MKNCNPFIKEGKWYKGNLHCHSTVSDGRLSPEEVVSIYKEKGWNFLAFTEHEVLTSYNKLSNDNFLVIPGIEMSGMRRFSHKWYHIVGIVNEHSEDIKKISSIWRFINSILRKFNGVQAFVNAWTKEDNLAIIAHPHWSRLRYNDVEIIKNNFAIEIFNYGCELESKKGIATDYWDKLLKHGRKVWGVAVDDAHHKVNDRCGGWIMVKASKLSVKEIAASLREGCFYSSNGPEIYEYYIEYGKISIKCSPVKEIRFITDKGIEGDFQIDGNDSTCSASYRVRGNEKYIRIECIDKDLKTAWTNPIFLK